MSFWYGARSKREMFYVEDFDMLQAENDNPVARRPVRSANRKTTGMATPVSSTTCCSRTTSKNHEAPEDCEFYMCGPP